MAPISALQGWGCLAPLWLPRPVIPPGPEAQDDDTIARGDLTSQQVPRLSRHARKEFSGAGVNADVKAMPSSRTPAMFVHQYNNGKFGWQTRGPAIMEAKSWIWIEGGRT